MIIVGLGFGAAFVPIYQAHPSVGRVAIVDSEPTNFYASHFTMTPDPATVPGAGGYIGPQHDGVAGARSAVFAIWGATASPTGCSACASSRPSPRPTRPPSTT